MASYINLPAYAVPQPLCIKCETRPRAAGGKLSRCIPCLQADTQREREARRVIADRVGQNSKAARHLASK